MVKFEEINSSKKGVSPETLPLEEAQEMIRKIVDGGLELNVVERWETLMKHPKANESMQAVKRVIGNTLITGADFIPLVGGAPSWLNTATKFIPKLKHLDLTPDVKPGESAFVQIASAPLEGATGGLPHLTHTSLLDKLLQMQKKVVLSPQKILWDT